MAITEPLLNEGAGYSRQGTTVRSPFKKDQIRRVSKSTPKVAVGAHKRGKGAVRAHQRGFPVRQLRTSGANPNRGRTAVPENESTVSRYTTSSVNAPLGYQGLLRGD